MDQNQNQNDNLFDFNNQQKPPQSSPDEPTIFSGSGRPLETPPYQPPQEQQPAYIPPPPAYSQPPAYTPPPAQPPQKSNRTWLIVIIVLLVLCCCCAIFGFVMYQWGGDWLMKQFPQNFLPLRLGFTI